MNYEVMAVEYFRRRLKKLSKKYRRIREDYKSLIETLENNPSEGDAIPGFCIVNRQQLCACYQKQVGCADDG